MTRQWQPFATPNVSDIKFNDQIEYYAFAIYFDGTGSWVLLDQICAINKVKRRKENKKLKRILCFFWRVKGSHWSTRKEGNQIAIAVAGERMASLGRKLCLWLLMKYDAINLFCIWQRRVRSHQYCLISLLFSFSCFGN